MRIIDRIYIDGGFETPHGTELFDLYNPAKGEVIGNVRLGDEADTRRAIAAAKRALPAFSRTSKRNASRCSATCTMRSCVGATRCWKP